MKTLTTTIIILALSFGAFSCKSTSKAKSTTETIPNGDKKTPSEKTDQKEETEESDLL